MPYFVVPASMRYHQMSLDDILNAPPGATIRAPAGHLGDTKTFYQDTIPARLNDPAIIYNCTRSLDEFVNTHSALYDQDRKTLYHSFKIPKRTGRGWRQIDQPLPELMEALRELKEIFEKDFFALYHTSAFAYVPHRCHLDAVKRHQQNGSRWFLKTDCSNFFGNTSADFIMRSLSQIWPFSSVCETDCGKTLLEKAIDIAMLNGGLPQGTPLSPMLTNLVMIPIDAELSKIFRDFNGQHLIYTRYADDIDVSCRDTFVWPAVVKEIQNAFEKHGSHHELKREKTHYGSCAGRNWILGVMYNKDQQITLGHKRKEAFRASMSDYLRSRGTEHAWNYGDLLSLNGTIAYFRKVEQAYTDGCLDHYSKKFGFNVLGTLRADIKSAF